MTTPRAVMLVVQAPAAPVPAPGAPPPSGWPVFRLGFRPFYLGALAFAVLAVPAWVAALLGLVQLPSALPPVQWHAHELLFGFATAVVVGFLLTAGKAWTGLATPRGAALAALAGLWLAARLAALWAPPVVFAVLDMALLPVVAVLFLRLLLRAGNRRNLPLGAMLALLAAANAGFHAGALGWVPLDPLRALHAGLALIVLIECVIGGRVIPAFTMSALPGRALQPPPWLEHAALAAGLLSLAGWVAWPAADPAGVDNAGRMLLAAGLAAAAVLHALRLWHWQPWRTVRRPILWVLHLSYAWVPVGFALLAWAQLGGISASAGVHALAVGATGGLIVGMVTRTARGHTGRPLQASRPEVAAYLLVASSALLRVAWPLLPPAHAVMAWRTAAAAWTAAFVLVLWVFTPWLLQPRADGRDG